jgi:hypothetical protein
MTFNPVDNSNINFKIQDSDADAINGRLGSYQTRLIVSRNDGKEVKIACREYTKATLWNKVMFLFGYYQKFFEVQNTGGITESSTRVSSNQEPIEVRNNRINTQLGQLITGLNLNEIVNPTAKQKIFEAFTEDEQNGIKKYFDNLKIGDSNLSDVRKEPKPLFSRVPTLNKRDQSIVRLQKINEYIKEQLKEWLKSETENFEVFLRTKI